MSLESERQAERYYAFGTVNGERQAERYYAFGTLDAFAQTLHSLTREETKELCAFIRGWNAAKLNNETVPP